LDSDRDFAISFRVVPTFLFNHALVAGPASFIFGENKRFVMLYSFFFNSQICYATIYHYRYPVWVTRISIDLICIDVSILIFQTWLYSDFQGCHPCLQLKDDVNLPLPFDAGVSMYYSWAEFGLLLCECK
jgi:hypothetical protein